jgi:uncharacterized membrane protein
MKSIFQFIRTTLSGGILFLLPIVLILVLFNKAHLIMVKLSAPLSALLPDRILGFDGSRILALVLLLLICFIAGLLIRSPRLKKQIGKLEENLLVYIPGYIMLKSIAADTMGESDENNLKPIIVKDGDCFKIGFLIEEKNGWSTVFIADAPRHDSGEVLIFPSELVRQIPLPSNKIAQSLKNYGKGAIDWIPESSITNKN